MTKLLKDYKALIHIFKKYIWFIDDKKFCNICDNRINYNSNEGTITLKRNVNTKNQMRCVI